MLTLSVLTHTSNPHQNNTTVHNHTEGSDWVLTELTSHLLIYQTCYETLVRDHLTTKHTETISQHAAMFHGQEAKVPLSTVEGDQAGEREQW